MATTEPIREKNQIRALTAYFLKRGQFRNYALISLGIYTTLRIGDLLTLKWEDVYDEKKQRFRSHLIVNEQKTGKKKTIAINPQAVNAMRLYLPHRRGPYIFVSRKGDMPISRVQAWRIICSAAEALHLPENISCHSLRKTWGYHAWSSGRVSPVVIMDIYNHSDFRVTQRYLGVTQDDLDKAYMEMDLL